MWDDPDQPPQGRYPARRPGPPPNQYPPAQQGGTYGNAPTERMPDGGYGSNNPYEPTDPYNQPAAPAFGPPDYGPPPPFEPQRPQYPGGQAPQWPGPGYDRPQRPVQPPPVQPQRPPAQYAAEPRYAPAQPYAPQYAPEAPAPRRYTPPPQQPQYAQQQPAHREERRAERKPRSLPHLPIAHVFLIAGVLAMFYAISQSWGVDASGAQVFVRDFGSARLSDAGIDAGTLAVRAATGIVIAAAALSAALILLNTVVTILNKGLGVIGLSGCASLAFFPVLWGGATLLTLVLLAAAGFAGLGALSHLPTVESHGFSVVSVAQHGVGYYAWCSGIAAIFIGMLGQLVLRRR